MYFIFRFLSLSPKTIFNLTIQIYKSSTLVFIFFFWLVLHAFSIHFFPVNFIFFSCFSFSPSLSLPFTCFFLFHSFYFAFFLSNFLSFFSSIYFFIENIPQKVKFQILYLIYIFVWIKSRKRLQIKQYYSWKNFWNKVLKN